MPTCDHRKKLEYLAWFDVLILTIIFWTSGILASTQGYLELLRGVTTINDNVVFTAADNYVALAFQAALLGVALLYLVLRNFNFKQWHIQWSLKAVAYGCLIFLGAALLMDVYMIIAGPLFYRLPFPGPMTTFFGDETVSTVIYAVFNGIYEEIYFLGICLSVHPRWHKWILPFSMLVRVSFHTYQGMLSALGIGVLFGFYLYVLYKKSKTKNLLPFFVAHSLGDIFGLAILGLLA